MLPSPAGLPFDGASLMSRQGMRPRRSHWHQGTDWSRIVGGKSERGTHGGPVAPGVVRETCRSGSARCSGYGNGILVEHSDDVFSWYAHLDAIHVAPGDEVAPGDWMYDVGTTFGTPADPNRRLAVPHLHLELVHAGWPFGSRDITARYDVLRELAASGVGLDGTRLVLTDPFDYAEPSLVADASKALSFSAVPKELDWATWPLWVAFGGSAAVLALIAATPGRRRYGR